MENQSKNILIVDSDEFLVQIYSARLKKAGFLTCTATCEKDIESNDGFRPDLVIVEPNTPGARRLDLIAVLKKKFGVPVVVVSIISDAEFIELATEAGADFYFIKTQNSFETIQVKLEEILSVDSQV